MTCLGILIKYDNNNKELTCTSKNFPSNEKLNRSNMQADGLYICLTLYIVTSVACLSIVLNKSMLCSL